MRFLATSTLRFVSLLLSASLIATLLLFVAREFLISYLDEGESK